jgi:hypothetical protein
MHCSFHCYSHSDTVIDRRRLEIEQSPAFPAIVQLQKVVVCIIHYLVNRRHGLQNLALNFREFCSKIGVSKDSILTQPSYGLESGRFGIAACARARCLHGRHRLTTNKLTDSCSITWSSIKSIPRPAFIHISIQLHVKQFKLCFHFTSIIYSIYTNK